MKKHLISLLVAASALVPVASAVAADLDTLPPPPVNHLRPAAYDWSGFYVGAWFGTACIDGQLVDNTAGNTFLNAGCGLKAGGLAGYNMQFDNYVLGAEVDAGRTTTLVTNTEPTANYTFGLDYLATARLRAGWALDDTLFFITGGLATAGGRIVDLSGAHGDLTANEIGWTAGVGLEHAVTDRLRMRIEYQYIHMGDTNYTTGCGTCNVDIHWGGEHEAKIAAIWAF